jgi:hypothetical protein
MSLLGAEQVVQPNAAVENQVDVISAEYDERAPGRVHREPWKERVADIHNLFDHWQHSADPQAMTVSPNGPLAIDECSAAVAEFDRNADE